MTLQQPQQKNTSGLLRYYFSEQETIPAPAVAMQSQEAASQLTLADPAESQPAETKKLSPARIVVATIVLLLAIALYFIWRTPTTPATATAQQNFDMVKAPVNTTTDAATSNTIQVYIVGAVRHPGVYTLDANARVFQLIQAAGGPQPNANLVAVNLAAKLSDGQEVYITTIGEKPPTYTGGVPGPGTSTSTNTGNSTDQLVNINTASADELRQNLHISSTTAQTIINYRLQHGSFTSVDQLSHIVSKSIFDKIKGKVTV